jgi:hypothetical protein
MAFSNISGLSSSSSSSSSSNTAFNTLNATNNDDYTQMTGLLDSAAVREIKEIGVNYANGNFDLIKDYLTQDEYNSLSIRLYKLKKPSNAKYEQIRKIISTNLEGLLQSVNLYNQNVGISLQRDDYKTKADMLNSIDSLIGQLNLLRGSVSLFPEQSFTVIPVEIKPEYLIYIKTYGYPENGIWDPDIMGSILSSIGSVVE